MSEHRILRAAIAAQLATVPGIGRVHDRERALASDKSLRDLYSDGSGNSPINGWHIRRTGRVEKGDFGQVLTTWEMRGFRAISDADDSELAFDDVIDGITEAWRDNPRMGVLACLASAEDGAPIIPELADSGPVMFCGVLCHHATLRLVTRHTTNDD